MTTASRRGGAAARADAPALVAEEPAALANLVHALYTDEHLWGRTQRGLLDIARTTSTATRSGGPSPRR